jgi:hypothetical protein
MSRSTIAVAVGCSLMLGTVAARAQTRPTPSLQVDLGAASSARTDAAVSPDRFDGFGSDLGLTYLAHLKHADFRATARGGFRALRSITPSGAAQSSERTAQAEVVLDAFRPPPTALLRPEIGLEVRAGGLLIAHRSAAVGSTSFGFGAATLGPAFVWPHANGLGIFELTGSVAAIGLVVQPYENLRSVSPAPVTRGATIASLQSFQTALRYTPRATWLGSRFSYEYRAGLLRYAGDSPVRELTQALSVGLALGGPSPR